MKLFGQMFFCVLIGIIIGAAFQYSERQRQLVEVSIERVVTSPEDHAMRFADLETPYTVLVYRPPQQRWAVPGIAGEVGDVVYGLPPQR